MEKFAKYRPKTFVSMDSLWYEEERLATFIDWPVPFISPIDLARDGFYYLRTKDHCACAFCRGIVGKWEEGDTPRSEHKKHYPECAFVLGKVTPNVPLQQGDILSRVAGEVSVDMHNTSGTDICGFGKKEKVDPCLKRSLVNNSSSDITVSSLGLRQYCGPKRKEFLTYEVRLNSFKNWPERVTQKPADLAAAGFYYCGLSDHVRCFHCGNGLRNWEPEDVPWEEHARWFHDCHFVFLEKGIDFIDEVRRKKPPYYRKTPTGEQNMCLTNTTKRSLVLTDNEMDKLMELHIMKHVLEMGFSEQIVRNALRNRLEETGQPFFSLRTCVDAVILLTEKEGKDGSSERKDNDVLSTQARKLSKYDRSTAFFPTSSGSSSLRIPGEPSGMSSIPQTGLVGNNNNFILSSSLNTGGTSQSHFPETTNASESILSTHSQSSSPFDANSPSELSSSVNITPHADDANVNSNLLPPLPNVNVPTVTANSSTVHATPDDLTMPSTSSLPPSSPIDITGSGHSSSSAITESMDISPPLNSNEGEDVPPTSHSLNLPNVDQTNTVTNEEIGGVQVSDDDIVVPLMSEADVVMKEAAKALLSPSTSFESSSCNVPTVHSSENAFEERKDIPAVKSTETTIDLKQESKGIFEQELERIREDRMCRVCMDKEVDVVFLPCTHMVTCSSCAVALTACPICRRVINYAFKPIIS